MTSSKFDKTQTFPNNVLWCHRLIESVKRVERINFEMSGMHCQVDRWITKYIHVDVKEMKNYRSGNLIMELKLIRWIQCGIWDKIKTVQRHQLWRIHVTQTCIRNRDSIPKEHYKWLLIHIPYEGANGYASTNTCGEQKKDATTRACRWKAHLLFIFNAKRRR